MQKPLRSLTVFALVLTAYCQLPAASVPSADEMPTPIFDDQLSTNWYAAVLAAVPASYRAKTNFNVVDATNYISQASRQGNAVAQALWGLALVVQSRSPEVSATGLRLLRGSAEKGCVAARLNLGYLLEAGKFVRRNYNEAFHWFSQAAAAGNAEAELELGGCYQYGLGTTPDVSMAAKYYRLSADQTNFVAMKSLGYLLLNGFGVVANKAEAEYWLRRAAKEGQNRRAMYDLGVIYSLKYPDTNAMAEAFSWMHQSAELGDALAAQGLANFYCRGWGGVQTNAAKYQYWRLKAATLGATESQFLMGQACRLGDGTPQDPEKSLAWYEKAAMKNHPSALYDLALHYLTATTNSAALQLAREYMLGAARMGHRAAQFQCALSCFRGEFGQDCESGNEWLAQAAENGWPSAELVLFRLYYNGSAPGKHCPAYQLDKTEALKWLRRSADHGNPEAQALLAVMLIRGLALDADKAAAGKLLRDAAAHGFAPAQNDLGFAILNHDIASTNAEEAAIWCKLALLHSSDPSTSQRASVNLAAALDRLTAEQQQNVEHRVSDFHALGLPQLDPTVKDWEKNPAYHQEDGQFGH